MTDLKRLRPPPLRICIATAEVAPFAKTGGLGEVTAALARHLTRKGHDVRLFLPFYASIELAGQRFLPVEFLREIPVEVEHQVYTFSVFTTPLPRSPLWIYLIDCPALYGRAGIYTSDEDEGVRFAFLTRATIECCQRMGWSPHIFHCNDWHTALLPLYLRTVYAWDRRFADSRTVLTIHNIAYQGISPTSILPRLALAGHTTWLFRQDLEAGHLNFLKTGILYADLLTTVSPTHAREIQTATYGYGLDALLRARSDRLVGILNGIEHEEWDPSRDPLIPFPYSADDLSGKERNKRALLERLSLPYEQGAPTLGVVSRLAPQKGFELTFQALPELLAWRNLRLVVLGSGDPDLEQFFRWLQQTFPRQVCFHRAFSNSLAHLIEAGADIFLMPSRYEPCGLNQMYSLRYGTPPIVRKTGGLADSVELFDSATARGTGFVFEHFDPSALRWALGYALDTWGDRAIWRVLMRNGMSQDFSWERQVDRYVDLYRRLLDLRSGRG